MSPPSLKDNTAEIDRLKKQIKNVLGVDSLVPFARIFDWISIVRCGRISGNSHPGHDPSFISCDPHGTG